MARFNLQTTSLQHPFFEGLFWLCVIICILLTLFGYGWLGVIGFVFLVFSRLRAPTKLHEFHCFLDWPEFNERKTIVFASDFHAGVEKGKDYYQQVLNEMNKHEADIIVLGGDFVEEYTESIQQLECLKDLQAKQGIYFVRGNHDYFDRPDLIKKQLEEWGMICLENRCIDLGKFELVGLQDSWFGVPDTSILTKKTKRRIVLMHEPDGLLDIEPGMADLILIGHTHGGQVRLPLIGPVSRLPQNVPQKFDRWFQSWKETKVLITQGIGESTVPLRFFCAPQYMVIELNEDPYNQKNTSSSE